MRRLAPFFALLLALSAGPATLHGNALVADLSQHLVAIDTGFTGADVLLFGTMEETADVAVVIRGPAQDVTVRRKERLAGIWVNGRNLTFGNVPAFYAVAATRPLAEFAPETVLQRHQIGADRLRLDRPERASDEEIATFETALLRNKRQAGLFPKDVGTVSVLSGRLFRTPVAFPSNVPTGTYTVEVFLIRDGDVVGAQTTPLVVSKVGFEADVFDFAHDYSALYGIVAILIALFAGWAAGAIFRKV